MTQTLILLSRSSKFEKIKNFKVMEDDSPRSGQKKKIGAKNFLGYVGIYIWNPVIPYSIQVAAAFRSLSSCVLFLS